MPDSIISCDPMAVSSNTQNSLVVYVAGPYTPQTNDLHDAPRLAQQNVDRAVRAGIEIMKKGHVPYIPHFAHYMHVMMRDDEAISKEQWYKFDYNWLSKCNALLYLAPSPGADKELQYAKDHGFKIFYSLDEIPNITKTAVPARLRAT